VKSRNDRDWDKALASMIDHTLLKAEARDDDVSEACRQALHFGFASVVVFPSWISLAREELGDSGIAVCSVLSFPFGAELPGAKAAAAENLLKAGASEIDMVMNIGAFLSGRMRTVREELGLVRKSCGTEAVIKLIIETAYLDSGGIKKAADMGVEAGFNFIKTSTGFASQGATIEDVGLISSVVGGRAGVKASGGIKTRSGALALVKAGATRLGCSSSISVVTI